MNEKEIKELFDYINASFSPEASLEVENANKTEDVTYSALYEYDKNKFDKLSSKAKILTNVVFLFDNLIKKDANFSFHNEKGNVGDKISSLKKYLTKHTALAYQRSDEFGLNINSWKDLSEKMDEFEEFEKPKDKKGQIKHASLSKYLKNHYVEYHDEIKDILEKCDVDSNVGSLPSAWIKRIPKEMIGIKTRMIRNSFDRFAEQVYSSKFFDDSIFVEASEALAAKLSKTLNVEAQVEFLDIGEYGKAFLITTEEDKFIFKSFHQDSSVIRTEEEIEEKTEETTPIAYHGPFKEVSSGYFASRNDNNFNRLEMGRLGHKEYQSYTFARLVKGSDILESTNMKKINMLSNSIKLIYNFDEHEDNVRKGKTIDYGGLIVSKALEERDVRKFARSIANIIDSDNPEKLRELRKKSEKNRHFIKAQEIIKHSIEHVLTGNIKNLDHTEKYDFPAKAIDEFGLDSKEIMKNILKNDGDSIRYMRNIVKVLEKPIKDKLYTPDIDDIGKMLEYNISHETLKNLNIDEKDINFGLNEFVKKIGNKSPVMTSFILKKLFSEESGYNANCVDTENIKILRTNGLEEESLKNLGFSQEQLSTTKITSNYKKPDGRE